MSPPKAYAYLRQGMGQEKLVSTDTQTASLRSYYDWFLVASHPELVWVQEQAPFWVPLPLRPEGGKLLRVLQSGDCLLVNSLWTGWANFDDLIRTLVSLEERSCYLHLLDLQLATSTSEGHAAASRLRAVFSWDLGCRQRGVRSQQAANLPLKKGLAPVRWTGRAPYGFRVARHDGRGYLAPCPKSRALGALIVELHEQGQSWQQIAAELARRKMRWAGQSQPGAASPVVVANLYRREVQLREQELWANLKEGLRDGPQEIP